MKRYKAFISYRKDHASYADLTKNTLVNGYGFAKEDLFLDKHDIGPEQFNVRIEESIKASSALILIITPNCLLPREDDWYLREIKFALKNNVTIIPLFFDGLMSLADCEIINQLSLYFTKEEIDTLVKAQGVQYNFDFSEQTYDKLTEFINQCNTTNKHWLSRLKGFAKIVALLLSLLFITLVVFTGLGFCWGYFFSNTDERDVLIDNTTIEGFSAHFSFCGIEAHYDLEADTIYMQLDQFHEQLPEQHFDVFIQSLSISGAIVVFNRNIKSIKYLRYLKGKQGQVVLLGSIAMVGLGSMTGFTQGKNWGRNIKQQQAVLLLYPKLKDRNTWECVFENNDLLLLKYYKNVNPELYHKKFNETLLHTNIHH